MQAYLKSSGFVSATLLLYVLVPPGSFNLAVIAQIPAAPVPPNSNPPLLEVPAQGSRGNLSPIPALPPAPNQSLSPEESVGIYSPIPAIQDGSRSPIPISVPSVSPDLIPNSSPVPGLNLTNNVGRSVLSIEINCQDLVENIQQKLTSCEKYLAIHRRMGDVVGEAATLNNIGLIYRDLGDYNQAMAFYQQALLAHKKLKNRAGEAATVNNIGLTYHELGNYAQALTFYQQALGIHREIGNRSSEGRTLNNLGELYRQLGQYSQSLAFFGQALKVAEGTSDRITVGNTLHNIGLLHERQNQYSQALQFYHKSLAIRREIGDKFGEGTTLNNIGLIDDKLGNHSQALKSLEQALAIFKTLGNPASIGNTLDSIGTVYKSLGQYASALEFYQQALALERQVGNRELERATLSNIGSLLEKKNQPELAIIFYKQSVNVTEAIRHHLKSLPLERESYTQTVANTYRTLADLLLSQGRILEAQQVLELLKIEELREYTRNHKAGDGVAQVALNPTEENILKTYGTLIAFGQRVYDCKQTQCSQLSQLNEQLQVVTERYNQTVDMLKKEISDRRSQDLAFFDPSRSVKVTEIVESKPGTVLIYPLVLEDKIWLIWAAQGGIVKSIEVNIPRHQLGETVLKFRQLLQDSDTDIGQIKATGKQLYDWLIKPIEDELKANQIKHVVFSLDRVTRYIPMSALFDGEKYLIENYAISTVLSADLTDLRDRLPSGTQNTSVLALGLSQAVPGFNALPNVPAELDALVRQNPNEQGIYPGLKFLNQAFDFPALRDRLLGKKILHIATHGSFVQGRPEDSYLLLGTGEKLTMPQIETLKDLDNIHLVVLSACETALGGPNQDGVEIAGMSYYFLNRGAKAVMASLWKVSDKSTSQLMQQFYINLANSSAPMTKTEALRQAQLSFIQNNQSSGLQFVHPYYWSGFVLIGNGL